MRVLVSTEYKKVRKSPECTFNSFMRRDVFLMRALSISRLMGFVKSPSNGSGGLRGLLFIPYHSRIWAMQGHASDPSSEDHKEMRKLALVHSLLTLSSLPSQCRPSGPTGGLAPRRPRGTAAVTDVKPGDERWRAIVSCYWNITWWVWWCSSSLQ